MGFSRLEARLGQAAAPPRLMRPASLMGRRFFFDTCWLLHRHSRTASRSFPGRLKPAGLYPEEGGSVRPRRGKLQLRVCP